MKLIELAYFTSNVAEMTAFYQSLLGIRPVAESPDMAIFMTGHTKLFIHRSYTPSESELPPENHTAFEVPNVDAACANLLQQGLTIEVPPQDYYWGRSAYLRDPDGHLIELNQGQAQDEATIHALYHQLLECWNKRDAEAYAALFAENGSIVGFDGSPMNGKSDIASHIRQIFNDHMTATYVAKIRETRFLSSGVALLRAVAGMIPPNQASLNPAANAIQTLIATNQTGQWQVAMFQNTPAQFHGRPELAQQLTEELQPLL